ncbi:MULTISPECIES: DUF432 domain-containing protein [unclassified Methanosarcina]|uniref:DUF432 domain-containing protein n=1 Tax=unclassified Methanosarcina TaxID=2644672 RepID=UPI0006156346|nr:MULTISPECIES: DUF432 domain-containing protein [unclassified Methanosarcina]AKB19957.1 hypothetical protein MSWHS_3094 [Methanosarcina sp. WWM596]AKB22247.1 hypothetical protein MSWH1_1976 [Methanosarcina sp. WH1]
MYGYYDPPFSVKQEGISISVEKTGDRWIYRRTLGKDEVEKFILGDRKRIIINPVEPLNTPKEITPNLLIEFEKTLLLAGGEKKQIFLTFPVEIGVFISENENRSLQVLDVFSLVRQKFTLYGEVSNGVVCKYWKSRLYSISPLLNPLQEGVMELTLRNTSSDWASISKAVFSAYGMKLYYDGDVFMKARMDILNRNTAETGFEMQSINGDLKGALVNDRKVRKEAFGVYGFRKLGFVPFKFYMEWGF